MEEDGMPRERTLQHKQRDFIFKDRQPMQRVTRSDMPGAEHILRRLDDDIHLLALFKESQGAIPFFKGTIYSGGPGMGKTRTACYLATESSIRCIYANNFPRENSSDWSTDDCKALCECVREFVRTTETPLILFFDQFENILDTDFITELYEQISGVHEPLNGILIIGATTKDIDDLDEQLTRPGRFGNHIVFEEYTTRQATDILAYCLRKRGVQFDDVQSVVEMMGNLTPATLDDFAEKVYQSALLHSNSYMRAHSPSVTPEQLTAAVKKHLIGRVGVKNDELSDDVRFHIALHEIMHGLVMYHLGYAVRYMHAVVGQKNNGGETAAQQSLLPDGYMTVQDCYNGIASSLASRYSQKFVKPLLAECIADLEEAAEAASLLVRSLGEGKRISQQYGPIIVNESASEQLKATAELDIGQILQDEEKRARGILERIGKEKIIALAQHLARERVLLQSEIETLFAQYGIERKTTT